MSEMCCEIFCLSIPGVHRYAGAESFIQNSVDVRFSSEMSNFYSTEFPVA